MGIIAHKDINNSKTKSIITAWNTPGPGKNGGFMSLIIHLISKGETLT